MIHCQLPQVTKTLLPPLAAWPPLPSPRRGSSKDKAATRFSLGQRRGQVSCVTTKSETNIMLIDLCIMLIMLIDISVQMINMLINFCGTDFMIKLMLIWVKCRICFNGLFQALKPSQCFNSFNSPVSHCVSEVVTPCHARLSGGQETTGTCFKSGQSLCSLACASRRHQRTKTWTERNPEQRPEKKKKTMGVTLRWETSVNINIKYTISNLRGFPSDSDDFSNFDIIVSGTLNMYTVYFAV